MARIYLCGGINGLSDADCRTWRERAAELLPEHEVVDPMRRDYRGQEAGNAANIVLADLDDIETCDAVIVNATRPSWGTAMEIVYADQYEVPVFAFLGKDPHFASPWLTYHCRAVVETIEQAAAAIRAL